MVGGALGDARRPAAPFPSIPGVPDTAPIRPDERFDEDAVAAHLRAHLPDLVGGGPMTFEQFPGGKANLTYLARAGDVELVLRRPPLGPVAPGSHDMRREYRVLSALHRAFPPAPRAYHLCEDPEVMGDVFFVMERRHGEVIREVWPAALPDTDGYRRTLAECAVDVLADLHLVDYEALGLGDLGKPEGFVERQVAGWTDRWHRAREDDVPAMDTLADALAGAVPAPQRATLLHNDFKIDNLMAGPRGEVVAVFDWDMATIGDPMVDLGTALAYWSGPDEPTFGVFGEHGTTLAHVMAKPEIVERYAARTGFDVTGTAFYEALALFRIAVIVQQIYIRWRRGQTGDDRFAALGALVPPVAARGVELLGG
ncbi:MAG: phosphotransferase family protein [Actinobacteria bacterium]|nr:phosphotransferase family protein [Actinomycetota bacterium]